MKKCVLIVVALFAFIAIATTKVMGQESTIQFVNQIGCELNYKVADLADIIANCDTLVDDDNEVSRLMAEYESTFPSELGPDEPAVAVLVPDHSNFNVIFLQETEEGEILTLRILSEDGWLECISSDEDLLFLSGAIAFIQHMDEVASPE